MLINYVLEVFKIFFIFLQLLPLWGAREMIAPGRYMD